MELLPASLASFACFLLAVFEVGATYYLDAEYDIDCPDLINQHIIWSLKTPFGIPDRALKSTPPDFKIRLSSIPKAGLGVYAQTFIPKNTWLGEYEGLILPAEYIGNDTDDTYMWRVMQADEISYFIDALLPETSNWLRYVNCPRNPDEENVSVHYCYGKVYYRTFKDVAPGQELMVYYGDDYAEYLGIDVTVFADTYV